METINASLSAIFAGALVVAYVVWKFVRGTHTGGARKPPSIRSLPLIGSLPFLPGPRLWHKEFLTLSAKLGNVFAFHIGSQYVSCIVKIQYRPHCVCINLD